AAAQELSLNALGVCELPFGMVNSVEAWLGEQGLILDRSRVTYVGLNHFGWLVRAMIDASAANVLEHITDGNAPELYVPPSIPLSVAEAAYSFDFRGLPNPYIGFLAHTPKEYGR